MLEAVGQQWAAKRVVTGCASISNQPSIRTQWDLASRDMQPYTIAQGWWLEGSQPTFDFARAFTDERVPRQVSHLRAMRSRQLLAQQAGQITPQWMMRIARDHYEDTFLQGPYFDAADPDFLSLCMHVSAADFTWGNTASSCVAVLPEAPEGLPVFWWTPGPPCNGCYVPFFVHGIRLPEMVSRAGAVGRLVMAPDQIMPDAFSADSYWWLFRHLMDAVKGDPIISVDNFYPTRNRLVRAARQSKQVELGWTRPYMEVAHFSEIEEEFLQRVQRMVWCNVATIDVQQRPRSRLLHPIWEGATGWIATHRTSHKSKHLAHNPYVSLAYITDAMKPVYVDCTAVWIEALDQKLRIWELLTNTPPPVGFDPAPDIVSAEHEDFGLLKLTPWRIALVSFPAVSHAVGQRIWRRREPG